MSGYEAGTDIVLVDDEPHLLAVQHMLLARQGLRVRSFRCPEAARDAILRDPPAAVVTDYRMEPMTGAQLAAELREQLGASCPPMMLASGQAGSIPAAERALFELVVSKPVDWTLLVPTVLAWVESATRPADEALLEAG